MKTGYRRSNPFSVFSVFFMFLCAQAAFPITHEFIAIDEGLENLLYINQNDSTKNWKISISNVYPSRDMQLVGNNRILIGDYNGYTEYNIDSGAIMRRDSSFDTGVTSVRRLANGQTILFGTNLSGSTGIVMVKLDSNNNPIKKVVYPTGSYVRIARQTNTGTFMLACDDSLREADTNGHYIWQKYIAWAADPTGKHIWKAERLDNGNILLSGGYGAFLAEIDTAGKFIDTIGVAAAKTDNAGPFFYAMWQRLSNGDIVVANWQGHGAGHDTTGKVHELIEFDTSGKIVWTWDNPSLVSSLQGVLILDSLNTNLIYDDRDGSLPMQPLTSPTSVIPPSYRAPNPQSPGEALPLSPDGRLQLFDLLGRSASPAQWKGGKIEDVGSGIYILKSGAGSWKYPQLRN
jgi:hypothetical protein